MRDVLEVLKVQTFVDSFVLWNIVCCNLKFDKLFAIFTSNAIDS